MKRGSSNQKQASKTLLIFDFDGTIADTKTLYYDIIYKNLKFFGFSYNKVDKAIDLGMNLKKTLKRLGFSFLVSWVLRRKIMGSVGENLEKVKKCKDAAHIKDLKHEKILVSNSVKEFMYPILKHFGMRKEFKEIIGGEDFGDKGVFLKKYIKDRGLKGSQVFYIGDRVADVKVAKKAGCKSIIIVGTCAWDSKKEIKKQKPDFIINNLTEIDKIVN